MAQQLTSAARADTHIQNTSNVWSYVVRRTPIFMALCAAWIATGGSLFFSEVFGWVPCSLCWYQRILMYPLSMLIAVGMLWRDNTVYRYVLPFSLLGACVSLYHYLLQKTDWLPPPACALGIPCTVDYINVFGFITIPFLALTAFLIISLMMAVSLLSVAETTEQTTDVASGTGLLRSFGLDRLVVLLVIGMVVAGYLALARIV